jgi:ribosomal protein S18 acetylase RimI-like enzyme
MIRDFKPTDAAAMVGLLTTQFPEEEAILGTRPEAFFKVIRRVTRWDARLVFGLMRLVRRPLFRMLVYDEGGRVVGTTLLSFPGPSVYLSMVVVDPAVRRRGYAKALLARAAEIARGLNRRYLVLDVLANNAPARALYEQQLGYRPLREVAFLVRDHLEEEGPERTSLPPGVRGYARTDDPAVVAVARAQVPADVQEVLPIHDHPLASARQTSRLFESETGAWVLDRGRGAEGLVAVTFTPGQEAAHMTDLVVAPGADPAAAAEMVRVGVAWAGRRGSKRVLATAPRYNLLGRAALEAAGFHDALSTWTLYRPVA